MIIHIKKFCISLIFAGILINLFAPLQIIYADTTPEITANKEIIMVRGMPANAQLSVALYNNEMFLGLQKYIGSGQLKASFASDLAGLLKQATHVRAYVWENEVMAPLCRAFESTIEELSEMETNTVNISVNGEIFEAFFYENAAAQSFVKQLPITLNMQDLNNNEKYYYFPNDYPTSQENPGTIHAGDIMLYGSNCIVIFYETFSTPYSYTKLGHIEDVNGLKATLGHGAVTVRFSRN